MGQKTAVAVTALLACAAPLGSGLQQLHGVAAGSAEAKPEAAFEQAVPHAE